MLRDLLYLTTATQNMPVAVPGPAAPSQAEQLIKVTSAIALELIKAHDTGQIVSLNEIRNKASKKFNFSGVPRLVDIISAVPDEYKKVLLPKLKARPIRTASGVSGGHFSAAIWERY
jgi:elongator complex protein 3